MNIAMFTDTYLPNTDGVVSSILAYRQGLEKEGHKLVLFAPDADGAKKEPCVYRFAAVGFPPYPEYRAAIFPYVSSSIAKKHGLEVVHCKAMTTMGLSAVALSKRCNLPAMASLETMIPEGLHYLVSHQGAQKIGKKVAWTYLRFLYSNFKLVTAPSKHAQVQLSENRIESIVLPSPIDTDRFSPDAALGNCTRKELGLSGKKVVLSVGRVVKEKNYDFLLSSAKLMKDKKVHFLVVGRGPYLEELKRKALSEGVADRISFAGFVPGEKLVAYYNAADALCFPSRFETQGLTLLEAFSCGKPSAVIRGTPMEEVVQPGKNGYVFSDDPADCAEKIAKCLEEKKGLSESARIRALEYSIQKCTARLVSCYKKLLE